MDTEEISELDRYKALYGGLSKENQKLREQLRGAQEYLAALCFHAGEPLLLEPTDFLGTREATLVLDRMTNGQMYLSAKRKGDS